MELLDSKQIKEILIKNWMSHDGMWFYHCVKECGIDKTNRINQLAVRSMAKIEIKRIQRALGIDSIENFEEFKEFLIQVFSIVKAEFMDFSFEFPSKNILLFTMNKCFAYDGIKRMGYIEKYKCGIFERLKGWFEELNIQFNINPKINGCMMREKNLCYREFQFYFSTE